MVGFGRWRSVSTQSNQGPRECVRPSCLDKDPFTDGSPTVPSSQLPDVAEWALSPYSCSSDNTQEVLAGDFPEAPVDVRCALQRVF